jgi:hypothetical protein
MLIASAIPQDDFTLFIFRPPFENILAITNSTAKLGTLPLARAVFTA